MLAREGGEPRSDEASTEGLARGNPDGALDGLVARLRLALEGEHVGLDLTDAGEKLLGFARQRVAVGRAGEELDPHVALEGLDAPPDRRMVHLELACGPRQ